MAEGEDQAQKTEDPTQKKLDDARKKGQVANSREVNHWFMIVAATLVVAILAPTLMSRLAADLAGYLGAAHEFRVAGHNLRELGARIIGDVVISVAPTVVLLIAAALGAWFVQNGVVIAPERLKPKLENISIIKGFGRMFSMRSVAEFTKGVLKLVIVGAVAVIAVAPELEAIRAAVAREPMGVLELLWALTLRMLGGVAAIVTIIAGIDFLYQRFEFQRSMRMSKQEIKDEHKQSEGDPTVKARLRQLRQDRARKRMMAAVPAADVVITNPTHFAVALKYDPPAMAAPKLVAKGVDAVALRIRAVAEENDVTVVENPPLARALYGAVDIDQEIPEAHYKAVAEVIGYVWRLKRRRTPGQR